MYSNKIIKRGIYTTDIGQPILNKTTISGTVNEVSESDKVILVYDRASGHLIASTMLDRDTREWKVGVDPAQGDGSMFIVCLDAEGEYNGDIYDKVSLCTKEYAVPAGLLNTTYWPTYDFIRAAIAPLGTHDLYDIDTQDLKGNITRIIGTNDPYNVRKEEVTFYDESNNTVVNSSIASSVLVNNSSEVINGIASSSLLKGYPHNVLNNNQEIVHPVMIDGVWYDRYSHTEIITTKGNASVCDTIAIGEFGEPCLAFGQFYDTRAEYSGSYSIASYIEYPMKWTGEGTRVSISFFISLSKGGSTSGKFSIVALTGYYPNDKGDLLQFTIGMHSTYTQGGTDSKKILLVHSINNASSYTYTTGTSTLTQSTWTEPWHHIAITYDEGIIKLYWNGEQVASKTVTDIQRMLYCTLMIGGGGTTSLSYPCATGKISDLRVFMNYTLTQSDIEVLKNIRPSTDTEVTSIKGIRDDGYVTYLGGIPFKPVPEYIYGVYEETGLNNYKSTIYTYEQEEDIRNVAATTPLLGKDYVFFNQRNNSDRFCASLNTRADYALNTALPYNMLVSSDIYIRFKALSTGTILMLGDPSLSGRYVRIWVNSSTSLAIIRPGASTTTVSLGKSIYDEWIIVELKSKSDEEEIMVGTEIQKVPITVRKIKVSNDEGTVYLDSTYSKYDKDIYPLGQLSLGAARHPAGSSTSDRDIDGCTVYISDVKIYASDTDNTQLLKWFKFGYEREGLGGLNILDSKNMMLHNNIEGMPTAPFSRSSINAQTASDNRLTIYPKKEGDLLKLLNSPTGWTLAGYYSLYSNVASASSGAPILQLGDFCSTVQNVYSNANAISTSYSIQGALKNSYNIINAEVASDSFNVGSWRSFVYTMQPNPDWRYKVQSYTSHTCDTVSFDVSAALITNEYFSIGGRYSANTKYDGGLDKVRLYPASFSTAMARSMLQNYYNKPYCGDIQVAFYSQKNEYPLYASIDVSSILIEGEDNGQSMFFAITNDGLNYFVYNGGWVKIMTLDGGAWKYLSASGMIPSNKNKYETMALAMRSPTNQMTMDVVNNLTEAQISAWHDKSIGVIDWAVGMQCTDVENGISPYVRNILVNGRKIGVSKVIDLSDFAHTDYNTCVYLSLPLCEGEESGIELYAHVSSIAGWVKLTNFESVPGIQRGQENAGTIQFMAVFDPSKRNGREPCVLNVQAGDILSQYAKEQEDTGGLFIPSDNI